MIIWKFDWYLLFQMFIDINGGLWYKDRVDILAFCIQFISTCWQYHSFYWGLTALSKVHQFMYYRLCIILYVFMPVVFPKHSILSFQFTVVSSRYFTFQDNCSKKKSAFYQTKTLTQRIFSKFNWGFDSMSTATHHLNWPIL